MSTARDGSAENATSAVGSDSTATRPSSSKLPGLRNALSHAREAEASQRALGRAATPTTDSDVEDNTTTDSEMNNDNSNSSSINSNSTFSSTVPTTNYAGQEEEGEDVDDEDESDQEEEEEEDDRVIEIESYVYHNGQKKMKKSQYTKGDLEKKMEANPKYASDWKKLIDQFDRKWMQQRKIFVESYVYQVSKISNEFVSLAYEPCTPTASFRHQQTHLFEFIRALVLEIVLTNIILAHSEW